MAEPLETPPAQQPPATTPPPGIDPAIQSQLNELKAQTESLKSEAEEAKFAAKYWQGKAEGSTPALKPKKDDKAEEVDPLDVLAREGKAGLKKLLASEGFISKDEVDEIVNQKAAELTTSDQLKRDYPELNDTNSQFYKDTAPVFRDYIERGYSRTEALKAAARDVELAQLKAGKRETPHAREEREARELAQRKADSGRGRGADFEDDEESDELTDLQKKICASMGISEDAYKKRAKAGVMMSGPAPFRSKPKGK